MSPRRGEGGGGRERGRTGSTKQKAGRPREKRAAAREEPPRGRARARSSRETEARPEAGQRSGEPAEPAAARRQALPSERDLLRDVIGDLLAPWEAPPRFSPPVDVCEREDVYEVVCELPGVAADDVHVSVHGDRLRIEGEKRWRAVREDEFVHAVERGHGRFVRAFRLPFVADAEQIDAAFDDGLLRVRVPKPRGGSPRTIQVQQRREQAPARELGARVAANAAEHAEEHARERGELGEDEALEARRAQAPHVPEPTPASGGVKSARPPHRPKAEGPLPLERQAEAYAPETTDDLTIPRVGGRQTPVGGQGAEQTSAGGIPRPGGEAKGPTKMDETPPSDYEASPAFRKGGQPVEGQQGGSGQGETP